MTIFSTIFWIIFLGIVSTVGFVVFFYLQETSPVAIDLSTEFFDFVKATIVDNYYYIAGVAGGLFVYGLVAKFLW